MAPGRGVAGACAWMMFAAGLVSFTAGLAAAASNDAFASAATVGSLPYLTTISTVGASVEGGEPRPCAGIGATVWYAFTPTDAYPLVADTFTSNFDTALAAYTGSSLATLSLVACNDDFSGLQSQVSFTPTPGTTYYFQAGGYNGAQGNLAFNLRAVIPNAAPEVPAIACDPNPSLVGDLVTCTFRSADSSSSGVFYAVSWGDGGPAERVPSSGYAAQGVAQAASHGYGAAGTMTITATATDNDAVPLTSAAGSTMLVVTIPDDCGLGRDASDDVSSPSVADLSAGCDGYLIASDFQDWYAITVPAGSFLEVTLTPAASAVLDVCVAWPNMLVAKCSAGGSTEQSVAIVAGTGGTYLVQVHRGGHGGTYHVATLTCPATSPLPCLT